MRTKIAAILGGLALLLGAGIPSASPAQAVDDICRTVNNDDGTPSFRFCVEHHHNQVPWESTAGSPDMSLYADIRVWNIPLANGGHTDLLTDVTVYAVHENGSTITIPFYNIADGDTDTHGGFWARSANTVWVEVHDSYSDTCERAFISHGGSTSEANC